MMDNPSYEGVQLQNGWRYQLRWRCSGAPGVSGSAILLYIFHHAVQGFDVYDEPSTQADIVSNRQGKAPALTTGAHAHAVTLGAA